MGFSCGIIGLPNVGKSTLFNALTSSNQALAANYPFATIDPNIGRVPIPDIRLNNLSNLNHSKKTIPTFLDFVDIAGLVKGASKGEGLGNKFLSHIRKVDAIAHVVRCFEDKNISHINNNINPLEDINIIKTELLLSDYEVLHNKKESLEKKVKGGDKEIQLIFKLVNKLIKHVEKGEKINLSKIEKSEKKYLKELNLISIKPLLYICNVDENSIMNGNMLSKKVTKIAENELNECVTISASIESQLAEFKEENEKILMLKDFGLNEPALNKTIRLGYNLLNLITFFTSGEKESRAWTIKNGTLAPQAAGKIHTDFEKGFIRAQTISYKDYIEFNGELGCKEKGRIRLEGKDYKVQDGDVFNFLYNV